MKNFYFLFFALAILLSSEFIRADGHGETKEVVEEKTEDTSEEKEEETTEEKKNKINYNWFKQNNVIFNAWTNVLRLK